MLLIPCPYCGKRPEIEFTHGGEAHLTRAARPAEVDDQAWADFLYMRANTKGVYAERWRHARGCGRFFNALRDTTTDHFLATYKAGEPRPRFAAAMTGPAAAVAEAAPDAALPRAAAGAAAVPDAEGIPSARAAQGAAAVPDAMSGADSVPGGASLPGADPAPDEGATPDGAAGTSR